MRNVVGIYMSTSSYAIDSAWSHLENDDKIEKLLPLIPLALAGYGAYRGYQNVTDPRGPVITDPLTGGMLVEQQVDPSLAGYAGAFGSGALEGVGLGGAVKVGAKGAGRLAGKSASKTALSRQAAREQARKETTERLAREEADKVQEEALRQGMGPMSLAALDDAALASARTSPYVMAQATRAARAAGAPGATKQALARGVQRGAGRLDRAITTRGLRNLGLGAAGLTGLGYLAGKTLPNFSSDDEAGMPSTSGFEDYTGGVGSGQSGAGAFGAGGGAASGFGQGYGMRDLTNVTGNRMGEDAIWTGTAAPFQGQHGRGTMAQRTVANQGTFGGFGMNKGDNMKIGEQILKEVTERMNDEYLSKAKCPKCGQEHLAKMGCVAKAEKCPHCDGDAPRSKCICGEAKKADKKPAHGMVIVIGSKAGPGPSKDGKRQKLDSEKDKKEE